MDSNVTLNTELFPMGLIEVLSYRCHFCDLVWFNVSKPSFCFSSLHNVAAPTLLEAYVQRSCWLPSVGLVASLSLSFQIPLKKKYYFHSLPSVALLSRTSPLCTYTQLFPRLFWKVVKFAFGVCKVRTKSGVNIMNFWIRFLNNWWQESLSLAFIINLIILFWILKILELYAELPRKICQSFIESLILLTCSLNFEGQRFLIITTLSSANEIGFDGSARIMFGRSFIKFKKNKDQVLNPEEHHVFFLKILFIEKLLFISTLWQLSLRYDHSSAFVLPLNP